MGGNVVVFIFSHTKWFLCHFFVHMRFIYFIYSFIYVWATVKKSMQLTTCWNLNWAVICHLQLPASETGTASFVQLKELVNWP